MYTFQWLSVVRPFSRLKPYVSLMIVAPSVDSLVQIVLVSFLLILCPTTLLTLFLSLVGTLVLFLPSNPVWKPFSFTFAICCQCYQSLLDRLAPNTWTGGRGGGGVQSFGRWCCMLVQSFELSVPIPSICDGFTFSCVRDNIIVLRKTHLYFAPSLSSLPKVALKTDNDVRLKQRVPDLGRWTVPASFLLFCPL